MAARVGEQLGSHMKIRKAYTFLIKLIQVGGFQVRVAMRSDIPIPLIIIHDQDHVRWLLHLDNIRIPLFTAVKEGREQQRPYSKSTILLPQGFYASYGFLLF